MLPFMDRLTGKYVPVMKARSDNILQSEKHTLARNRRMLILKQLVTNGKIWLHDCDKLQCVNDRLFNSFWSPPALRPPSDGCGIGDTNNTPLELLQRQIVGADQLCGLCTQDQDDIFGKPAD